MNPGVEPTWPRRFPILRFGGIVVSLLIGVGLIRIWQLWVATPLERFYFPSYLRLWLSAELPHLPKWTKTADDLSSFSVVFTGKSLTTNEVVGSNPEPVSVRQLRLPPEVFRHWLRVHIYGDRDLPVLLRLPLVGFGATFATLFLVGARLDRAHDAEAREGRRLRGPKLTSRWLFNRKTKGDGLRFRLDNSRNLLEWFRRGQTGRDLMIRRDREAHHIQIAGDTGTGKSTLVRQIIYQIEARREAAIIFDPDREYIQEFFSEKRGDWVLNPKDDRCPYWPIGTEANDEAEATPIAIGLFPDEPTRQQFFLSHTRAIFTYLLGHLQTNGQRIGVLDGAPRGDRRSRARHRTSTHAHQERSAATGRHLGQPQRSRKTATHDAVASRQSTVLDGSGVGKERRGWIFITSTPDTIDALRPMQSLWLDMLILKLQTEAWRPGQTRVWIILDELASLNALPQLHSALTKQRKSDNPIVLGFQGMSQLDAIYGKKAETILSQAYTNFILRTREPRAAKHLSELIGKAQLERARESKPSQLLRGRNGSYSSERVVDPVVMESEIQGLEDLNGYFVQQDKVVAIRFSPRPKRKRAPALVERVIPPVQHRPLNPEPEPELPAATAVSDPKMAIEIDPLRQ